MARERRRVPLPAVGSQAKVRHGRVVRALPRPDPTKWRQLNAYKEAPKLKHKSYFELAENTEKKKKLDFQVVLKSHIAAVGQYLFVAGHHQHRVPTWIRVHPYRPARVDHCMQGTVERAGCLDNDCFGTSPHTYLPG
jgi:hypothetical protein